MTLSYNTISLRYYYAQGNFGHQYVQLTIRDTALFLMYGSAAVRYMLCSMGGKT